MDHSGLIVRLLISWLREFVDLVAPAEDIKFQFEAFVSGCAPVLAAMPTYEEPLKDTASFTA